MAKIKVKRTAMVEEVTKSRNTKKYEVLTRVSQNILIRYIGFQSKPCIDGKAIKVGETVYKGTEITD